MEMTYYDINSQELPNVGDTVMVRPNFGMDHSVKAIVTFSSMDIKNGTPGIDYKVIDTGKENWAYLNQVTMITERAQIDEPKTAGTTTTPVKKTKKS